MTQVDFALIGREERRDPWRPVVGGVEWQVPHIADLEIGAQLAVESCHVVPLTHVLRTVGLRVEGDETVPDGDGMAEAVLSCHREGVTAFVVAWLAHGGLEPGESLASSRSSASSARP